MIDKEAIEIIKHIRDDFGITNKQFIAAYTLAIKALEAYDKILPLLNPDIDAELALEKIREVMYE